MRTTPTRVLLDDHELVRRRSSDLLAAATADEALHMTAALAPDVAVLDVRLPDRNGVVVCRELRASAPGTACRMLTSYDDEAVVAARHDAPDAVDDAVPS